MSVRVAPTFKNWIIVLSASGTMTLLGHPGQSAPAAKRPPVKRAPVNKAVVPAKQHTKAPAPGAAVSPTNQRPSLPGAPAPVVRLEDYPPPSSEIMKVSDVRAGMKGYGLTVFRGTKIERFGVEVVGVMPNTYFGQPLILVKLHGGPITERGAFLIQGMSGSPIYINGKLLGAFSQGNAWPKDALGMVTPIEAMQEALDPKLSTIPAGITAADLVDPAPAKSDVATGDPFTTPLFRSPLSNLDPIAVGGQSFRPMALPVTVSGLSGRNLDRVSKILQPLNMSVMQGPGGMGEQVKAELVPGAAIGVALMTGDIDMTAIGTVTYREGNKLLAFGHPMMQLGATQFPITTAWIHDVFSGFQISHKIGSAGQICGTLTQDRPFSIAGQLGAAPPMIPVRYHVSDKTTGRSRTYNVQAANHPLLVSQLLPIAVNQGLFNLRPVPGDAVAHVKMKLETEGAGTITRENIVYDPGAIDVAAVQELLEVMRTLSTNSFRRVPVKKLDMEITIEDKRPTAVIDRIYLPRDKFEPGEEVEVGVAVRPYRKDPVITKTKIRIPQNATNGRAMLLVQGGATRVVLNTQMPTGTTGAMPTPAPDASLRQVLKKFMDRERNDQIVVRLVFPSTAVNVNGERISQLPSSLVEVMKSSKTTGFRLERDEAKVLENSDYIVTGLQTLPITVQKEDRLEKPKSGNSSTSTTGGISVGGTTAGNLSTGGDYEDLSTGVLRLTVDGQPRAIRLFTPEEEEEEEAPKAEDKKERKKAEKPEKREPKGAKSAASGKGKSGQKSTPVSAAAKTDAEDEKPNAPTTATASATDDKLVARAATAWTQTSQADFERGTLKGTAVTTNGDVRMAPSLSQSYESNEQFVWSVVALKGALYAGTGNGGQVLKITGKNQGTVFCRTGELQVHALTKDKAGNLYAGTSPNGKILKIGADGKATELFSMNGNEAASDAGSKFVLSLVTADDGTLYAGTGPDGKIYRMAPGGAVQEFASVPKQSVTALALGADGTLYAGTAEDGSVYRITPDGRAAMLYDTDQAVITGLAIDGERNVFAATSPAGQIVKIDPTGTPKVFFSKNKSAAYGLLIDRGGNLYTANASSILRVEPDGDAILLTDKQDALFTCLAWDEEGRIAAGSANVGGLYRLGPTTEGEFQSSVHDAKLPARWGRIRYSGALPEGGTLKFQTRSGNSPDPDATWSAWQDPTVRESSVYVASPAARFLQYRVLFSATSGMPTLRDVTIYYLPRNQAPRLTLAVPQGGEIIRGTKELKWAAADPDKDTLTYELAYSADNGRTWKPVGQKAVTEKAATPATTEKGNDPASGPTRASAEEALKRYRDLLDKDDKLTPQQKEESFTRAKGLVEKYFQNNPEGEVTAAAPKVEPKAAASSRPTGTTREATFKWDTTQVPDGIYMLRITATDKASNPGEPQADVKVTEPFIVANTPPQVFVFERGITVDAQKQASVVGFSSGRVTLKGAQYRVGDGDWSAIEPEDGIWDSAAEHFRFVIPALPSGEKTLEVKVVDVAGNSQLSKVKFTVP